MIPIPRIPAHRRQPRSRVLGRGGEPCLRDALLGIGGFLLAAALGLYLVVRLAA